MNKIFLDTDIIIDLLAERNPFYQAAAELFSLAEEGRVRCFTSPIAVANIYYILARLKNENFARRNIVKLKTLVSIASVNEKIVDLALESSFKDFEDALQYYTALSNKLDAIITRNKKDYLKSKISLWTAEEYLKVVKLSS